MKREDLPSLPTTVIVTVVCLWVLGFHAAAVLVLLIGGLAYAVECTRFPWVRCGGCNGSGEQWSWWSAQFRTCRRCGGLRKQVCAGRRLWTKATDINEDRK